MHQGFAAGTRVHTKEGLKCIEQIEIGDLVLSHPPEQQPPPRRRQISEYLYRRVTRVNNVADQPITLVSYRNYADGILETLQVTAGQPIWSKGVGWVAAGDLTPGHAVVLSFNGNALIVKTALAAQQATVYSLEVDGFPTFYVEQLGAWVHCDESVAVQPSEKPAHAKNYDFTKPQLFLEIADYYNDTFEVPLLPVALPNEQVVKLSNSAERLRGIALENRQVELQYDAAGLRWLTDYIDQTRSIGDAKSRKGSTIVMGAFLGECILRNIGGEWATHKNVVCVRLADDSVVFPFNKVNKQFENGSQGGDSALGLYQSVMALQALSKELSPAQERLLDFHQKNGHRIYIPLTMDSELAWLEIDKIDEGRVTIKQSFTASGVVSLALSQITSFYVCAPDGKLIHPEWIAKAYFATLPKEILAQIQNSLPADTSLTLDQTESGKKFIAIDYAASDIRKAGRQCYATTLRNVSDQKIKILKFGGLRFDGTAWALASVTSSFYTLDDFKDWYHQKGEWLLPGESCCDPSNWGSPPVLWAYYGITESNERFIAAKCLEQPLEDASAAQWSSGAHYVAQMPPRPDMAQLINELRSTYQHTQNRMSSSMLASISAPVPPWLGAADPLNEIMKQQDLLLKEGKIVWGAVIQANKQLFSAGQIDCPALLAYSDDTYFDDRPQELRLIGRKIFALKDTEPTDPALKHVAQLVSDEMDRSMGFKLPPVFSNRDINAAAFLVFRKHIPKGVLSAGTLPLLVHPSTEAVMIVPFEFWPIQLIIMWKEERL